MVRNAPIAAADEVTQMNPSQRDSMVTKKRKVGSGSITRIVDGTSAKRPWPAAMLPRRPINKSGRPRHPEVVQTPPKILPTPLAELISTIAVLFRFTYLLLKKERLGRWNLLRAYYAVVGGDRPRGGKKVL